MACYGNSFTSLYVADVRTSQEAQTSMTCYGNGFTLYLCKQQKFTDDLREHTAAISMVEK
jgi:hypothetical protein